MKSYSNLCISAFAIVCIFVMTGLVFAQSATDVVINEIMYAPTAGASQEWFEIYNKSTTSFNLNNWKWKDSTATIRTITTQNVTLAPNAFAVVCQDSAALKSFYPGITGIVLQSIGWNALNNTGDQVILYNASGLAIDSLHYFPSWGGSSNNISLERRLASGPRRNHAFSMLCSSAATMKSTTHPSGVSVILVQEAHKQKAKRNIYFILSIISVNLQL